MSIRSDSTLERHQTVRRSSRLKDHSDTKATEVLSISISKKTKRQKLMSSQDVQGEYTKSCVDDSELSVSQPVKRPVASGSDLRRSRRVTPTELAKREKALFVKEQEFDRRAEELKERIASLSAKEVEASHMLSQIADREKKLALCQLEEHFTCALCYEIMASPYTLNPPQCGHTFCAICILKWFFSRLHRACGGWHESVDCPICRSLLIVTPDRVPRLNITFPFVPNRTAAAVLESLIEKLAQPPLHLAQVKLDDPDGGNELGSRQEQGTTTCNRKRSLSKEKDTLFENSDVNSWREGGFVRSEWLKKDRDGRREMNDLQKRWCTLESPDFVALKQRLEV